jgi:Smg protein
LFFEAALMPSGIRAVADVSAGALRYSDSMFDVLVYVYEHYWRPDACPEAGLLARKLSAVGFEEEEIADALAWLEGLRTVSTAPMVAPAGGSARVLASAESERFGPEALGFLHFLESAGVLTGAMRELVLDRAMAVPRAPLTLEDFKVLVLLAFWSRGEEPDSLVLDELFVDDADRVVH